ncbi:glycosyltransferase family 4 protein [Methanolobus sp. ZRKC2]|uniref:glycosyltransferase family 4 protein n=1 Tax=Methanolobus sp. ZRKC2 TaxID=3125783 RepID=UPI0032523656
MDDARVLKEATSLSEGGHELVIWGIADDETPAFQQNNGFSIKRISRQMKQNTLLGKLAYSSKFIYHSAKEKADVYHAHDLSTLLECYIASKLNKSKVIYDSHELYIRDFNNKNNYKNLYFYLEHFLIRKVNLVITVNNLISKELQQRYKLENVPSVIMNCPSLSNSEECNRNDELDSKYDGKNVIVFQGVIREGLGLRNLIRSVAYLSDDYNLLMIGDGPILDELIDLSKELSLDDKVHFTGKIPHEKLLSYTKNAHLGVIYPEKYNLSHYYMAPNKFFEYIHSNIPVLVPNYPFLKENVLKYKIGLLADNENPEDFAKHITQFFSNREKYDEMKRNTEVAKNNLNWENEERKLLELYSKL